MGANYFYWKKKQFLIECECKTAYGCQKYFYDKMGLRLYFQVTTLRSLKNYLKTIKSRDLYFGICQFSVMEFFAKIIYDLQPLAIFDKSSIIDVRSLTRL